VGGRGNYQRKQKLPSAATYKEDFCQGTRWGQLSGQKRVELEDECFIQGMLRRIWVAGPHGPSGGFLGGIKLCLREESDIAGEKGTARKVEGFETGNVEDG